MSLLPVDGIRSVTSAGAWVFFTPWRKWPAMGYAVDTGADSAQAIHTCVGKGGLRPHGKAVVADVADRIVVADVAGVSLADVVARTRAHPGARLDPRLVLASASAALRAVGDDERGADARLDRGTLLTWAGEIVWLHATGSVAAPWWRHFVEDVLAACGCPGPSRWRAGGSPLQMLDAQRDQLAALSLDDDVRRALGRVLAVGLAVPLPERGPFARRSDPPTPPSPAARAAWRAQVRSVVDEAAALFGGPVDAFARSVVAELFAAERAADLSLREEAGVLGAAGLKALSRRRR